MWRAVAASVLLLACARPPEEGESSNRSAGGVDSLVLERTRCYGVCPAYRLRISAPGQIRFESRNPGDEARTAVDTAPATTLSTLASRARDIGFFDLPSDIAADSVLCRDRATDHPTVTTTIFAGKTTKTVVDYHGCFQANDHSVLAPIGKLRAFENEIDSVLKSSRWVRPASRR